MFVHVERGKKDDSQGVAMGSVYSQRKGWTDMMRGAWGNVHVG